MTEPAVSTGRWGRRSRAGVATLGVTLLVLAAVGAGARGPLATIDGPDAIPRPSVPFPTFSAKYLGQHTPAVEVPDWVEWALWLIVGLGVAVLVVVVLRRVLEMRRGTRVAPSRTPAASVALPARAVPPPPDLTEPLARARGRLREGAPPRDAVVAAWVALEEGARRHGATRAPSDTATEYATSVLASTNADPTAVAVLRERYLAARFHTDPVTAEDVAAASAALSRIEATWSE